MKEDRVFLSNAEKRRYEQHRKEHPLKPITNADRIRSMTDEELAEYMAYKMCPYKFIRCENGSCKNCLLDWLKQEVEQ